jgi:hypothetical protein
MQALTQVISQRNELVNILMEFLPLEKEAAYRRLRGEVPFSFLEAAIICRKLGISLDNIIGADSPKSRPVHIKLTEQVNPTEIDYAMLQEFVDVLSSLKGDTNSYGGEATNIIPQPLYLSYENISKFYLFKWKYLYDTPNKTIPFKEIEIPDRLRKIQLDNVEVAQYVYDTTYIFDYLTFHYLVNDLKSFRILNFITEDEIALIKEDLLKVLKELEDITISGMFPLTGNKVNIYISNMNFPTSYCYIHTKNYHISMVKAFILNGIASLDNKIYAHLENWIRSLRRQSTLITQSAEKERISFLKEQYSIISSL